LEGSASLGWHTHPPNLFVGSRITQICWVLGVTCLDCRLTAMRQGARVTLWWSPVSPVHSASGVTLQGGLHVWVQEVRVGA
jgi:hypothetical protein